MNVPNFWKRVDKTKSDCWIWTGPKDWNGYGLVSIRAGKNNRKTKRAHLISVLMSGRKIPKGMECDHLCENSSCVRPEHISVTTPYLNNMRGNGAAAINNRKTHCNNGHELLPGSFYLTKPKKKWATRPSRNCKICHMRRIKRYMKRKKAKLNGT